MTPRIFAAAAAAGAAAMVAAVLYLHGESSAPRLEVDGLPVAWRAEHLPLLVPVQAPGWLPYFTAAANAWRESTGLCLFVVVGDDDAEPWGEVATPGVVPVVSADEGEPPHTALRLAYDGTIRAAPIRMPQVGDVSLDWRARAAAHELGHALGLDHDARRWTLMAQGGGWEVPADTVATLREVYGQAGRCR